MLVELAVRDLGVVADVELTLGPGMTVVTGETGAGKTLVVSAIDLVCGGRTDPSVVRPGAEEAVVEARFVVGGDLETVLRRVVPARGRPRGSIDGRMATVQELAERGGELVEVHGQHGHQELLRPVAHRRALDAFGRIDGRRRQELRHRLQELAAERAALGGDAAEVTRRRELLGFVVAEIDAAGVRDVDELASLEAEEAELSSTEARRAALAGALAALAGEDAVALQAISGALGAPVHSGRRSAPATAAVDAVGLACEALRAEAGLEGLVEEAVTLQAALEDLAGRVRQALEAIEDDPERLAAVQARQRLLRDLCRKHGPTLADVRETAARARAEVERLDGLEARRRALDAEEEATRSELSAVEADLAEARRKAAPVLARAVEGWLRELAMPQARLEVRVDGPAGDEVELLLGANPGEPALPLARVASGGELSRTMLALRLVLSGGPEVMVFDEVDAGVGGAAALAVGRALAELATHRQVLVVTHLAQVAAYGDDHVVIEKVLRDGRTVSAARRVSGPERVAELARMLSGHPESEVARHHAEELLAASRREGERSA